MLLQSFWLRQHFFWMVVLMEEINALYIRPQFFYNPFLSFIEYFVGPYADELGNVLPQAVEGLGVPVDPLAFAGLLGSNDCIARESLFAFLLHKQNGKGSNYCANSGSDINIWRSFPSSHCWSHAFHTFHCTSITVDSGLTLNFLNYFNLLSARIWGFWEDAIILGGLTVFPQVMWSIFVPYLPQSILLGALSFMASLITIVMARMGKLSRKMIQFVEATSGWTATLLFMWMPVSQMRTNYLNPQNIRGLSTITLLLSTMGNGLMIPRALFIRDVMWFTGSVWATLLHGWGNTLFLYIKAYFLAVTSGLILCIGMVFWKDANAHGLPSPFSSLTQLVSAS